MKNFALIAALMSGLTLCSGSRGESANSVTVAVFGDWPYNANLLKNSSLLVRSINADSDVRRVIFVGDIHSGTMPCVGAGLSPTPSGADPTWNKIIFDIFSSFNSSVIYTPGDNEWVDCHKTNEMMSGYPLNELASVRSLFFAQRGRTLGQADSAVSTQAVEFDLNHKSDSQFVENVIWEDSGVVFVTLNMPGSNNDTLPWTNGFENPKAHAQEIEDRNAANMRWLDTAFERAHTNHAKAIVIALHADMWESEDGVSAYTPFVQHLASQTEAFKNPVLLVNGDSHSFKKDKPLADPQSETGSVHHTQAVPNLTRISVQGSINNPAEWLRLTIDPSATEVFRATNVVYCRETGSATCE